MNTPEDHCAPPPYVGDLRLPTEEELKTLNAYAWEKAPSGGPAWERHWHEEARRLLGGESSD
jgi:hypothetical protein